MASKTSLSLKVAGKQDFAVLQRLLFLLVVLAAALSPQPVTLIVVALLMLGAGHIFSTPGFSKPNDQEWALAISADGRISLCSSCGKTVEGFLAGQQWCTRWASVLRITSGEQHQTLVVLSRQQSADEYRRLNAWLRHGAAWLLKSEGRVQS